jgi:hypothetical protein
LFYNFRYLAILLFSGGMDFVKSNSSPTVHTNSGGRNLEAEEAVGNILGRRGEILGRREKIREA